MTTERQIEILRVLKKDVEEDTSHTPFMCVLLLRQPLEDPEVQEIMDILWDSRVTEKTAESRSKPFIWYKLEKRENKQVRIQNIDNAIKKLQESLEITK